MVPLDKSGKIPESYKQLYSFSAFYTALYRGMRTIGAMRHNRKTKDISKDFIERIMLAVTEVNGCPVCSYGHTKWALEVGMSSEEINLLMAGSSEAVPSSELVAVLFAQHYADSRGNPSHDSWQRVLDVYGLSKSMIILGATRAIMIGNIWGMAFSSFSSRLKGKPSGKTNIFYEVGIMISIVFLLPIAIFHALIAGVMRQPVLSFKESRL